MATTTFLQLLLIEEGQDGAETVVNEGLTGIDTFLAEPAFTDTVDINVPLAHTDPIQTWRKDGVIQAQVDPNGALEVGDLKIAGSLLGLNGPMGVGTNTVVPATDADHPLSTAEQAAIYQRVDAGAWTIGRNLIVPAAIALWIVRNNTGFSLTVKTAAGTGIAIADQRHAVLFCGGVNVIRVTADSVLTP